MARIAARSRNPAGHAGFIDNAVGFVSALFAYVETRMALLAIESKAMLLQMVAIVAFGLGALIALVFGYIFIIASIVVGIAHLTGVSWTWISLGTGFLHLLIAATCAFLAKSKLGGKLYVETRAELKEDQQWLKSLSKTAQE